MTYDRNPKFGEDQGFQTTARRVGDMLWENTKGDLSQIPSDYLATLRHQYAEGKVSMLELMDRVDLGEDATYEDYCEVFEDLIAVDPKQWPDPNSVLSVDPKALREMRYAEPIEFDEFDFAEGDMGQKMEKFLKKVIASVYRDGVTKVTDENGKPPSETNNFLLSEDGTEFSGIFYDMKKDPGEQTFPFVIKESTNGQWSIKY